MACDSVGAESSSFRGREGRPRLLPSVVSFWVAPAGRPLGFLIRERDSSRRFSEARGSLARGDARRRCPFFSIDGDEERDSSRRFSEARGSLARGDARRRCPFLSTDGDSSRRLLFVHLPLTCCFAIHKATLRAFKNSQLEPE